MTARADQADWKLTTAHRVLVRVGWSATMIAVCLTAVAWMLPVPQVWWMVTAFAASGLLVGLFLPEPIPRDLPGRRRAAMDPAKVGSWRTGRGVA